MLIAAGTRPGVLLGSADYQSLKSLTETVRKQIQEGQIVAALQGLAVIQKRSLNDPEAKFVLGEILQELAALKAEQLQRVAPESAAAHELLGKSLESQGKLDDALAEYRQALDKTPAGAGLHFLIGNVEWKLKRFEDSQADFKDELKINPHHAMANLRMGQILIETQRDHPLQAVDYLQEASLNAKNSLEVHRQLGKALRLAGKYSQALKELRLVEAQAPNDESVHAQLAALYKDMGDPERARQEIELHAKILRNKLEASQKARVNSAP